MLIEHFLGAKPWDSELIAQADRQLGHFKDFMASKEIQKSQEIWIPAPAQSLSSHTFYRYSSREIFQIHF